MTAAVQHQLAIVMLPTEGIRPSPFNPRKTFTNIEDLAENLRAHGIKVPLRVRPVDATENMSAHHELVFGERRWRAAKLAEIAEVPCIVEEMTDAEARMLMLVELAQTSDVHPVEEAEVYRQLHEQDKLSVEEIALKVGKSRSHVYGRMKLAELAEPVRKAALAGEIPATHALLLARVPPALQEEALQKIVGGRWQGAGPMSFREAQQFLVEQYTLRLAEAPWDLKDEQLVPAAGSCSACPKRTGNQPELFSDVKVAKDTCTDPACHSSKREAFVALRLKRAQDEGKPVLSVAEAKKVIDQYGNVKSPEFVDLDEEQWFGDKRMSLREKLGKKAPEPTLAPTQNGLKELARKEDVDKLLGREKNAKAHAEQMKNDRAVRQFDLDQKRRAAIASATMAAVVGKLETKQLGKAAWFIIANAALEQFCDYQELPEETVVRRLGHGPRTSDQTKDVDEMAKKLPGMSAEQLCAFTVEMLLMNGDEFHKLHRGEEGAIGELAQLFGIDKKKVAEQVKAEEKAQAKALERGVVDETGEVRQVIPKKKAPAKPTKKPAKAAKAAKPKKGKKK